MPQRTWGGGSGSSSSSSGSSSSSRSSSSSNSSSSWSSSSSSWRRNSYGSGGDDGGGGEPADPMTQLIWVGVILLILGAVYILPPIMQGVQDSNDKREEANATATTRAITLADLALIHAAIDPRLADWKRDAKIGHANWLNASDAGFPVGSNTRGVMYGYCDQNENFYVYVLNINPPNHWKADVEGYAYIPNTYPSSCFPNGWEIIDSVRAEETGWYFMIASTFNKYGVNSTLLPATVTPLPTSVFKN